MNCLYETVAGAYMQVRGRFAPPPDAADMLADAEENLEGCRGGLRAKEVDAAAQCDALAHATLTRKKAGDLAGARFALQVSDLADPARALRRAYGPCFDVV